MLGSVGTGETRRVSWGRYQIFPEPLSLPQLADSLTHHPDRRDSSGGLRGLFFSGLTPTLGVPEPEPVKPRGPAWIPESCVLPSPLGPAQPQAHFFVCVS